MVVKEKKPFNEIFAQIKAEKKGKAANVILQVSLSSIKAKFYETYHNVGVDDTLEVWHNEETKCIMISVNNEEIMRIEGDRIYSYEDMTGSTCSFKRYRFHTMDSEITISIKD
jgi:hypothetical protein